VSEGIFSAQPIKQWECKVRFTCIFHSVESYGRSSLFAKND